MSDLTRKAAFGAATIITTAAAAAFAATGTAHAATQASSGAAARTAHSVSSTAAAPELPAAVLTWPLVVQGARGERVFAIQYLLNARGAHLATDGIYGPATAAAVRAFQKRVGLPADGKVGNQTWPRLIVQVRQGNRGSAVAGVQHNLRFAYGYKLAVDGIFGPATAAAVRNFQARFKIGVDGIVGPITWNKIVVNER